MTNPLRALIAKWRESTTEDDGNVQYALALDQCADELEAALAAQDNEPYDVMPIVSTEVMWKARAESAEKKLAALAAEPQKNGGLTTAEVEAIVDNAFSEAAEPPLTLECPCCGDDAWAGREGDEILDGTPLRCGCKGQISCDSENAPAANASDCDCGR